MKKSQSKQAVTSVNKPTISEIKRQGEDFYQMVSEAAYYRSEKRDFKPGYEMEDWIAAEAEILALEKESLVA